MDNEKLHPVVLVLEDERPLLEAIRKKLELSGFDVVTARAVDQALNYLTDLERVDVIWLDHYLLGKENGLDFVVKVKASPKWKIIPLFVVSNTGSPNKMQSYLMLGITKYFTKADYRLEDIIGNIQKFLSLPKNMV